MILGFHKHIAEMAGTEERPTQHTVQGLVGLVQKTVAGESPKR